MMIIIIIIVTMDRNYTHALLNGVISNDLE